MKWSDIFLAAFNNLMRRKLRSMLTMLGVVIGTAAIVVTISLGYGAEKTQMAALESYSNLRLINVWPSYGSSSSDSGATRNRITKINDSVLARVRHVSGVDAVTPVVQFYMSASFIIKTGKLENNAWVTAVYPRDFARIKELKEGTYFSNNTDRMEFITSEIPLLEFRDPNKDNEDWVNYWDLLMNDEPLPLPKVNWLRANYKLLLRWEDYTNVSADSESEPVEKEQEFKAKMMGILKTDKQELNDPYFNYGPVVNLNWVKRFVKENKALMKELQFSNDMITNYQTVMVLAKDVDSVTQITKDLVEMGLQCSSALTSIEQMRGQIRTMQAFLGFIGMISMFVAALSIANTMMMSIYERTREIGVMKVLGCKLGNIRMMFLSEAAFIGFFGGLFGLALSFALSWALNNVPALKTAISSVMNSGSYYTTEDATTSIIPAFLAMGTWLGVVVVSVVSGIQPAQRAMKLSSLAAIRSAD